MANATRTQIAGPNGYAANLTPFTGNNVAGIAGPVDTYGRMDSSARDTYRAHAAAADIRYTVVSYATPIVWVLTDGTIVDPGDRYSVTTKKQMASVLPWLGSAVIRHPAYAA